jgi:hypothetical protein
MIARFIVKPEEARTGSHAGVCGVCAQYTERGVHKDDVLQKTTSNVTVTFPGLTDTMCEYCLSMWDNGKPNKFNRALLATEGKLYFPLIAANPEIQSEERPTWGEALRALKPEEPRVCVLNLDFKKRVWPRAKISQGDALSILIHDNSRTFSDNLQCSLSRLIETLDLLEKIYTLGFSKAAMETSLMGIQKQVKAVGFNVTMALERELQELRQTPEFLPAIIVCQKRETVL